MSRLMSGYARRPDHLAWCQNIFNSLKDGGMWGVPRSGLIFQKRGDKLVLTEVMPHYEEMPVSADKLREDQQCDYRSNKEHFEAAGITVECEVEW